MNPNGIDLITARQRQIVTMAAAGAPNKLIAESLDIGEQQVKNHLCRVYGRLGIKNRAELVLWAVRAGLVSLTGGIGAAA